MGKHGRVSSAAVRLSDGTARLPHALPSYGEENKIFIDRLAAIISAAETYFIGCPDQQKEAELNSLLDDIRRLSIKRHRIAHGHIAMWAEFKLPADPGRFEVGASVLYRWGTPWYSMTNLRTDPVGTDSTAIDAARSEFESVHNRVFKFTQELSGAP